MSFPITADVDDMVQIVESTTPTIAYTTVGADDIVEDTEFSAPILTAQASDMRCKTCGKKCPACIPRYTHQFGGGWEGGKNSAVSEHERAIDDGEWQREGDWNEVLMMPLKLLSLFAFMGLWVWLGSPEAREVFFGIEGGGEAPGEMDLA